MRLHKPHGARSRGTARCQAGHSDTPPHSQQLSWPRCSLTSACADQGRPEGGRGQPPHPTKKKGRGETHARTSRKLPEKAMEAALPAPLGQTGRGGRLQEQQPQTGDAKETRDPGGQPPGQAGPRAAPTGPTAWTPRDDPAQPGDRLRPANADHNGHRTTARPEQRPPRTG